MEALFSSETLVFANRTRTQYRDPENRNLLWNLIHWCRCVKGMKTSVMNVMLRRNFCSFIKSMWSKLTNFVAYLISWCDTEFLEVLHGNKYVTKLPVFTLRIWSKKINSDTLKKHSSDLIILCRDKSFCRFFLRNILIRLEDILSVAMFPLWMLDSCNVKRGMTSSGLLFILSFRENRQLFKI